MGYDEYELHRMREIIDRLLPGLKIQQESDTSLGTFPFPGYNQLFREMVESVDEAHKLYGPEKAGSVLRDYSYKILFLENFALTMH